MKRKQNKLQKITQVLNTSSETFMLIALISLFALPFVIVQNLEPIVRSHENVANYKVQPVTKSPSNTTASNGENQKTEGKVLGVETVNRPLDISEDKNNLSYFNNNVSNLSDKSYSVEISTNQLFGRISLFKIKNNSLEKHSYKISVENLVVGQKQTDKYLFIDEKQLLVGSTELPTVLSIESNKEVTISLISNKSRTTNVRVNVELAE